jgi:hypothetical protein
MCNSITSSSVCRIPMTFLCKFSMSNEEYIDSSNGECKILPTGRCKDYMNNLSNQTLESHPNNCIDKITY